MGHLVDRLAQVVGGLRQVQAQQVRKGNADAAIEIQERLIKPLQDISMSVDGSAADVLSADVQALVAAKKVKFPKSRGGKGIQPKGRRKPGRLKWVCCSDAYRTTNRRSKPIWAARCRWKKGDTTGESPRLIADGKKPKPREIRIKGKRMKRCQAAQQ